MSGTSYPVSPSKGSTFYAPSSPSKSTLQRNSAVNKHSRDVSASSPRRNDDEERRQQNQHQQQRMENASGRLQNPPSPGKENFPLLAFESRGRAEHKTSKLSIFRGLSPERKSNSERRERSVSPSKREKKQTKSEAAANQKQTEKVDEDGPRSKREIDEEFVNMLSEMEVPSTLRLKLMSMDAKVKDSMMKGQATLSLAALSAASGSKSRPAISDRLRKSRSSSSIIVADDKRKIEAALMPPPDRKSLFGGPHSRNASAISNSSASSTESKQQKKSKASVRTPDVETSPTFLPLSGQRSRTNSFSSATFATSASSASASTFATMLKTTDSSRLDVTRVKKMRAVLSAESPSWIGEFVEEGGYTAMLTRLKELLNLEWREEQHDDQLLHELLRCFVALSTTDRGQGVLQSMAPTPFVELSCLLFSEKRPGELATRKLLVELLSLLIVLPSSASSRSNREHEDVKTTRETSTISSALASPSLPSSNLVLLITLLHNLRDADQEAKVDFITASHAPRPFKSFVSEFLNVNRDYFWVFCHSNRFWSLDEIDVDDVECPKVPGGMTGGVEFEAMAYLTTLFRLLNGVCAQVLALARSRKIQTLAYDFHSLLFSSGLDRALSTTRKASQVYYQPLHLQLARYFDYARQSSFPMPIELEAWQSNPRLLTTEHRYDSDNRTSRAEEVAQRPFTLGLLDCQSGTSHQGPSKAVEEASAATPTQKEKAKLTPQEKRNGVGSSSGRWLGGEGKRSSRDAPFLPSPVLAESTSFDTAMLALEPATPPGSNLPQSPPKGTGTLRGNKTQSVQYQASMVGSAVRKWEQIASDQNNTAKHQGGLGLGWAPSR
ncbi:hypothetical protein CBS101457_006262 [Exobasidium rhododendri]|nr:hypothetical protein CBS101457_006262 [Exobasidium rhododendri]